jgi:hypothetical protein
MACSLTWFFLICFIVLFSEIYFHFESRYFLGNTRWFNARTLLFLYLICTSSEDGVCVTHHCQSYISKWMYYIEETRENIILKKGGVHVYCCHGCVYRLTPICTGSRSSPIGCVCIQDRDLLRLKIPHLSPCVDESTFLFYTSYISCFSPSTSVSLSLW